MKTKTIITSSIFRGFSYAIILMLTSLIFACGGITGRVFLDEDGDNVMDVGEGGLPGVRLVVVNEGKVKNRLVTDKNGNFFIPSGAPGSYYIQVDTNTSSVARELNPSAALNKSSFSGTAFVKQSTTPPGDPASTTTPPASTGTVTTGSGSTTTSTSSGPSGSTTGTSTAEVTTATIIANGWTDKGYQVYLADSLSYQTVLIPIPVDRSSEANLNTNPTQQCFVGKSCSVIFETFAYCTTQITIPDSLVVTPQQPGWTFDEKTRVALYNLSNAALKSDNSIGRAWNKAPALAPEKIQVTLQLSAASAPFGTPVSTALKPIAVCGERITNLADIALTISTSIQPYLTLTTDYQKNATSVQFTVDLKNAGQSVLEGNVLIAVETSVDARVPNFKANGECGKLTGNGILCSVAGLEVGASKQFTFSIDLPTLEPAPSEATVLTFTASLSAPNLVAPISAVNPVVITLPAVAAPVAP